MLTCANFGDVEVIDITPEKDQKLIEKLQGEARELELMIQAYDPHLLEPLNRLVVKKAWDLVIEAHMLLHRVAYRIQK